MTNKQSDAVEASSWATLRAFVRLLVCTPRRWYFALSLVLVLGLKYIYRPALPMPVREYFTTYRIKYSDPGQGERASKSFAQEPYRPQWAMLNPYDRDMAIKYFESTKMIIDAGRSINYTVRYWHEGQDIYEHTPVDIRFTSDSISDFDAWSMRVEVQPTGVQLSKLSGTYIDRPITSQGAVFIPYDSPSDTPLGLVTVRLVRPIGSYKNIILTKMREVDAQDLYDGKMRRHMGSNLIELFLTSDCTRAFARDLFYQIGKQYEAYAREYYIKELGQYLERLDEARQQIAGGYDYLEAWGLQAKEGDPATRRAMIAQLDKMVEEAQTNALLLGQEHMIELLDDTLIRTPKQTELSLPYVNMGLLLLFVFLPVLALVVELALRRPVLAAELLPSDWGQGERCLQLPTNQSSPLEWDLLALQLGRLREESRAQRLHIADCHDDERYTLPALLEMMPPTLREQLTPVPALNTNLEGVRSLATEGVPLIIRLRCGFTPEAQVRQLHEWAMASGLYPIILWDDRL